MHLGSVRDEWEFPPILLLAKTLGGRCIDKHSVTPGHGPGHGESEIDLFKPVPSITPPILTVDRGDHFSSRKTYQGEQDGIADPVKLNNICPIMEEQIADRKNTMGNCIKRFCVD